MHRAHKAYWSWQHWRHGSLFNWASVRDATRSDNQGQRASLWRPNNNPRHAHLLSWHCSWMHPLTAQTHLGAHWEAKYNVSFQRRHSDERSQVNCLGYNGNLPVRPSHFPWQLGLTSPHVLVNKPWGRHSRDWAVAWRPDSTCHLIVIYRKCRAWKIGSWVLSLHTVDVTGRKRYIINTFNQDGLAARAELILLYYFPNVSLLGKCMHVK